MKHPKITLSPEPHQDNRYTMYRDGKVLYTTDTKGVLEMQRILNDFVIMQGLTHDEVVA